MKIIHTVAAAFGVAALAACAPPADQNVAAEDDTLVVDNLVVNEVVTDNMMMNDMDMNAMDMNVADDNMVGADNAATNTGY